MPRHEHLIHAALADRYPSQWISVHCDTVAVEIGLGPRTIRDELIRWVGCGMSGANGAYGPCRWSDGTTAYDFWRAIDARLKRGGTVWAISERAVATMALLGVWQQLETGELYGPTGKDVADSAFAGDSVPGVRGRGQSGDGTGSDDDGGLLRRLRHVEPSGAGSVRGVHRDRRARTGGAAVLSDPPTVLDLRRAGLPGTVRWVDPANYGLAPLPPGSLARVRSERCAEFVRRASAVCVTERLGSWCATVASQSDTAWRRSHQTHLVLADACPHRASLIEDAYYGGRCEAYRLGTVAGPVYHSDVAALYPSLYAMAALPVCPVAPVRSGLDGFPAAPERVGSIAAEVALRTDMPDYPYRSARLGVTIWPVGRFRTTLAGPELRDAFERGRIVKVNRWQEYKMGPALAAFGQHMLALRATFGNDQLLGAWLKMLANCIVGKLGQKDRGWEDAPFHNIHAEWGTWDVRMGEHQWQRWRSIAGRTQRERKGSWSYGAVPAIAAWITSLGRMRLLGLLRTVGARELHYCDTDSVFCTEDGQSSLAKHGEIGAGRAGKLAVKGVYDRVVIHGIKTYECDGALTAGGKPRGGEALGSHGERVVVREGLGGALSRLAAPDSRSHTILWTPSAAYRHGVVSATGAVSPHVLDEE